jgi:hypothetical protein
MISRSQYFFNLKRVQLCRFVHHRTVAKRKEIIPIISKNLQVDGRYCVEYIFTKPKWHHFLRMFVKDSHSTQNPYGHSAIRYLDPDTGEDTVMNVCGLKDHKLINFIPAEEYLFTEIQHPGNEQRGVFQRSFIGLRIENLSISQIKKLAEHYKELEKKNLDKEVSFFLMPIPLLNVVRRFFGKSEIGNCSYWTSQGLKKAKIISRGTSFPLLLFFQMLKQHLSSNFSKVNIVSYLSLHHPTEPRGSFIYPMYWLKRGYARIWNLDDLSNLVFELKHTKVLYPDNSWGPFRLEPVSKSENQQTEQTNYVKVIVSEEDQNDSFGWVLMSQRHVKDRLDEIKDKLNNIFKR